VIDIAERGLSFVNGAVLVPLEGVADLPVGRPGPLHLVVLPEALEEAEVGGGEILRQVEALDVVALLLRCRLREGILLGLEEGSLDSRGGELDEDGRRPVVGCPGVDPEGLMYDVGDLRHGGDGPFLLGVGE